MPALHHLLRSAAEVYAERVAVRDGSRSVTYGQLDTWSNRVAHQLIALGVERGDRVGIYLEKSLESIVAVYGILKAGGAYVPFDPHAPTARLAFIADNAQIRVLVTGWEKSDAWEELVRRGDPLRAAVVLGDAGRPQDLPDLPDSLLIVTPADVAARPSEAPSIRCVDVDLAYILYTSGSTGEPKGVMLTHRNALTFVDWAADLCSIGPDDRLSSHAPLHFDLSIFDVFAAAKGGAALVLVPPEAFVLPTETARFIDRAGISVWYSVPTALSLMVQRGGLRRGALQSLRTILFAGEVFPIKYLRELMSLIPHASYINLYGPTETNVCTYYEVPELSPERTEPIPIGAAIDDVEVFTVTEDGRRGRVGEAGELYVRGPSVMQGYWNDPARSATALVPHPFLEVGDPVYRTGDIACLGSDGMYTLLGRRDQQIKSRGYRIELGEIETALYAHPSVVECAVTVVPDQLVTNRVKAHVVVRDGLEEADLIRFCSERIPSYMIPEMFEFIDRLPKTSTGKVDRRLLSTGRG